MVEGKHWLSDIIRLYLLTHLLLLKVLPVLLALDHETFCGIWVAHLCNVFWVMEGVILVFKDGSDQTMARKVSLKAFEKFRCYLHETPVPQAK